MDFSHTSLCGRPFVSIQNIRALEKLHTPPSSFPSSQASCDSVPCDQRRNPRRSLGSTLQKPPTLVRQEERKASFVDGLVGKCLISCSFLTSSLSVSPCLDSAAQMVEVIWPLSVASCKPQAGGVLSLRRYIEETLRRSRTSYSTLQVALYYLVLIMPCVPKSDFTMQQSVDSPSVRAMQCGRRMFLAALILASKYLQDRNYSAKAWSKMSGLKVAEINLNERAFLGAVNWKLHIPDHVFRRWTDVVLRYTPSQSSPPAGQSSSLEQTCWKSIIPQLTPDLENVSPVMTESASCVPSASPAVSYSALPSFLEPQPEVRPRTPVLGVSYLPTPRLTPPPALTPAASVGSIDSYNVVGKHSRRSSFSSETCTVSSPLSVASDSTRLSPASSVTSVSSTESFDQKYMVKTNTSCMNVQAQYPAYDAQPQASRAAKRSQDEMTDSDDQVSEALQLRVYSLLNQQQGTRALPIVLDDEDCTTTSMAADEACSRAKPCNRYNNKVACYAEDTKRRRTSYGEKSWNGVVEVPAY
jgi:hypothetical protein